MKGTIINDWTKFDYTNADHQKHLLESLRYHVALPDKFVAEEFADSKKFRHAHNAVQMSMREFHSSGDKQKTIEALYHAFTTTGDFPLTAIQAIEKFHALTNYDNGYEQIFDVKDFTNSNQPGFKIVNVTSGMTFERIEIGDKIRLKQMSGSQAFVLFDFYGGGLNWHKSLFMNQEFWQIEDNAMEFVNKAYARRAQVHYALLEAAMAAKTCITLTDPACGNCTEYAYALAAAINLAATRILTNNRNKGYGATVGNQIIILTPLAYWGAVKQALDIRLQPTSQTKIANYNFQPVVTMMLTNANQIGVFLPKLRIKSGYRMNLETFNSFDMLSFSEATAGWQSYGAGVGDLDQIECIDGTAPSGMSGGPIVD